MSISLPFLYLYRSRYISYPIEGVIHMTYGRCAGGALTRTVEPPNKASVPRCILGPRWVHTTVPSRIRHAACRALRAVRWLLRCCVACNWLRCMLWNDCGARCIMAFLANASRRMQRDASCVLLLHVASTSSVSSPGCARPSCLPACRMLRVACCSAECMVRVATCCTALQPVATCCAGSRRVAPGCNGLHGCAVSVSVGHIRSVTVHVDWPTRSVAVEISGACYSRCRGPVPRMHGLTPTTSGPALGLPMPRLHRDWAGPCHIRPGTWRAPAVS
jgi:hypothetical protein